MKRRSGAAEGGAGREASAADLACDLAHEVGNLLAAVRLQAHLVDEDLSPVELASASLEMDELAGRAGALLALMRPLLAPRDRPFEPADPAAALSVLRVALDDQGTRGRALDFEVSEDLPRVAVDFDVLQWILTVHVIAAVDAAPSRGQVRVFASREDDGVLFRIEDEGRSEEPLADWRSLALRGRPLACALASHILARVGGGCEAHSDENGTQVSLRVPAGWGGQGGDSRLQV